MIELVIFDMDGILIDSEPLWQKAEKKVFGKHGLQMTTEMCKQYQAIKVEELIKIWYDYQPWENFNMDETREDMYKTVEEFVRNEGEIMEGVEQTLEFFKKKKIPLSIASGSDVSLIDLIVNKLNIKHYFDFIHSGQNEKRGKPFPYIFLTVANHFNIKPENCLVFEDSKNGVKAGKAAGMKVVAVPEISMFDNGVYEIADLKLRSLSEFNEEIFYKLNSYEHQRSI